MNLCPFTPLYNFFFASQVRLEWPTDLAVNPMDNSLYVLENNVILRITENHQVCIRRLDYRCKTINVETYYRSLTEFRPNYAPSSQFKRKSSALFIQLFAVGKILLINFVQECSGVLLCWSKVRSPTLSSDPRRYDLRFLTLGEHHRGPAHALPGARRRLQSQ